MTLAACSNPQLRVHFQTKNTIQRKAFKMAFAVVYLIKPKKHIVVPENFIFDRNDIKLKNYGVNSNQVFWCESDGEPNFDANESNEFPPISGEGCYKSRIWKFFGRLTILKISNFLINRYFTKFLESKEEANEYKTIRRAQIPATYNENRPNEQPIPRCEFTSRSCNENMQSNEINSTVTETESDTSDSSSMVSFAGLYDSYSNDESMVSSSEPLVELASLEIHPYEAAVDPLLVSEDIKPIIDFNKMNEQDAENIENILIIEDIFGIGEEQETCGGLACQPNEIDTPPNRQEENDKNGQGINWEPINGDDDDILIAPCEKMPKPHVKHVDITMKSNDIISGKMLLFGTDVSWKDFFNRKYLQ